MPAALNILIADDDEGDRKQIVRALTRAGMACDCVETASVDEALGACDKHAFDCAIVDYRMPGRNGLDGISALHHRLPFMSIIMATGEGDEAVATEAMKRGAADYIPKKSIDAASIKHSIENSLEKRALQRKVAQQREELQNFAKVLVHDLSAPITSIQLFARMVDESLRLAATDKRETVDYCRQVITAANYTGGLIDTLHEYTKLDAQVTFEPVEMRQVMEVALANLNNVIMEREARVTYDELPCVIGNSHQLTQILQNLIGNAIKYCEASPPIVHIAVHPCKDHDWLFSVKDNGIGIPEEYYARVFEPFKRLHGAGEYPGTGLGLAICKKVVERHGGTIRCVSKEGEGTIFFFTLPGVESHP